MGDLLLIRPGAKVPVDAEVIEGTGDVDESTVTGESMPVPKGRVALVGATINRMGTLRARATAVGSDTALAQIVKLVQEAQASRAPGQRLADRAAFWLVLVALVGGLATFAVWYWAAGASAQESLLFAITVVVICPDAPRAGDADGGDGGHRARGAARHPLQDRRGARGAGEGAASSSTRPAR